jgi:2',3'-cyclic-nucleotide 2'-phosphodiesterase
MNILLCGDVVGRPGRDAVKAHLPLARRELRIDVAIVNAENMAHGFGLNEKLCGEMFEAGADILTTGNHAWDQKEIIPYMERQPRVLRPANFPPGTPGSGTRLHTLADGRKLLVVNLMGRLFMEALDDPFRGLDAELAPYALGRDVAGIVVDFHAEATSEKAAFGHHADGRVSAVVGTHTHVPTADHRILPGGTAFVSDTGMCGNYDSVIGMQKEPSRLRFVTRMPAGKKPEVAEGEGTLCGVLVVIDDATGHARRIEPVRLGGVLAPQMPAL